MTETNPARGLSFSAEIVLIYPNWEDDDCPIVMDDCALCETRFEPEQEVYAWAKRIGDGLMVLKAFCSRDCVNSAILQSSEESGIIHVDFVTVTE